jgi:predicted transcriptional regulator
MNKRAGRPSTVAKIILSKAQMYRTVEELARETGASPDTVRAVLRRASDRGEIVLRRFVSGKSGRTIMVA